MADINIMTGSTQAEDSQSIKIGEMVRMLKNYNASNIKFFVCPGGFGLEYVKNEDEKSRADLENLGVEIQKNINIYQSCGKKFKAEVCVSPKADKLAVNLLSKLEDYSAKTKVDREEFNKNLIGAKQGISGFKIQKIITQNCIDEAILKYGDDKFLVRQAASSSIKDLENCYKKARANVAVLKSLDEGKIKRTKQLDKLLAEFDLQEIDNPVLKHMSEIKNTILATTSKHFQIYHDESQQPIKDCQEIKNDLDNTKTSFEAFLDCATSSISVKK